MYTAPKVNAAYMKGGKASWEFEQYLGTSYTIHYILNRGYCVNVTVDIVKITFEHHT